MKGEWKSMNEIATMTDSVSTATEIAMLQSINDKLELLILLIVMFWCVKVVKNAFYKLYRKGV